jgi:hypothetical protein
MYIRVFALFMSAPLLDMHQLLMFSTYLEPRTFSLIIFYNDDDNDDDDDDDDDDNNNDDSKQ